MSSQEQRWSGNDASWLCPTPVDRARMLELDERLGASTNVIQPLLPLAMIVAAFWVGPWALLPLLAVPLFMAMPRLLPHLRQPEWLLLSALVVLSCTLATAIGLTGGLRSPLIFWPLFMVIGVATRFSRRGVLLITAVIVITNLTAIVVAAPLKVAAELPTLVNLAAVAIVCGHYTRVLAGAEFDHREAALLDPLTGLLNRTALMSRFEELRQQAAQNGRPIAVIVCDLDHFKDVNDHHGHDRGDVVLREAAYELRKATRSFELIYRIGGEEFLLVLPGVETLEAQEVAERLRKTVASAHPGGLPITASFGISAARGTDIEFEKLFRAADQALYAAKTSGRNTVVVASAADSPSPAPADRSRPSQRSRP
jgi:diguanylate cyclase (GGDEF)-like protein